VIRLPESGFPRMPQRVPNRSDTMLNLRRCACRFWSQYRLRRRFNLHPWKMKLFSTSAGRGIMSRYSASYSHSGHLQTAVPSSLAKHRTRWGLFKCRFFAVNLSRFRPGVPAFSGLDSSEHVTDCWTRFADLVRIQWNVDWRRSGQLERQSRRHPSPYTLRPSAWSGQLVVPLRRSLP
jgi:hypothetical protein